jgi:hypothetical protein
MIIFLGQAFKSNFLSSIISISLTGVSFSMVLMKILGNSIIEGCVTCHQFLGGFGTPVFRHGDECCQLAVWTCYTGCIKKN